ncbi:hypothetical protein [Nocardia grenadensis]|uniref:hypothetical protein n=1 Tax=Nocardia grenadensis TaxID=931537 RepID=UPI003D9128E1
MTLELATTKMRRWRDSRPNDLWNRDQNHPRPRPRAHRLLTALRSACSPLTLVSADGDYTGYLVVGAKDVLALTFQIVKRSDTSTWFQVIPVNGLSNELRMDRQTPPLRT